MSWRTDLKYRRKRKRGSWSTYESTGVALVQKKSELIALRIAARVLEHISTHHGSQLEPVHFRALIQQVEDALPESLNQQLDAEAEAVLDWLIEPKSSPPLDPTDPEQLATVRQKTVQRLSLFESAIETQHQVTFEYYSTTQEDWFVMTGQPLRLEVDEDITWLVVMYGTRTWSVDAKYVRWLVLTKSPLSTSQPPPKQAKVLSFPPKKSE